MRDSPSSPAPAASDSPKRMITREIAVSPASNTISREMTCAELTHAYQHLASQSEHDKIWCKKVEEAITDHAQWIDKARSAFIGQQKEISSLRVALGAHTQAQPAPSTPLGATTSDQELRSHVQATDATTHARLDAVEAALRGALASFDVELRQHTREAVEALANQLHVMQAAQGMSPTPSTAPPACSKALYA